MLANAGLPWRQLSARAEQVILFGSYAAGCASPRSDIDLICVGQGPRRSSRDLHLLWIASKVINNPEWTKTEIGAHVAKYGVWLKGERRIGPPKPASSRAIDRKFHQISDRSQVLAARWSQLSPRFRNEQVLKLRRDIQRLDLLTSGQAVPPNTVLDQQWLRKKQKQQWVRAVLSRKPELWQQVSRLLTRRNGSAICRNNHRTAATVLESPR